MSIIHEFFSKLDPTIDAYELISSINHFFKKNLPTYHLGLSMERQYRFCSPALNLVLAYQVTGDVEKAVKAYQVTKLAVCYIYACDNFYETRNRFYRRVSNQLLVELRRELGEEHLFKLDRLLESFDRYWCFEDTLREKIRNGGRGLSNADFWRHVLLRSSNARLYALILKGVCDKQWKDIYRYLSALLYFNLIIDDLQNDLDDLARDIASGEPNLFVLLFLFRHNISELGSFSNDHIISLVTNENESFFHSVLALLESLLSRLPDDLEVFHWLKRFISMKIEIFERELCY